MEASFAAAFAIYVLFLGSCLDDFCFMGSLLIFRGIKALKKLKSSFQDESELFDLKKNMKMSGLITARGLCKAEIGR